MVVQVGDEAPDLELQDQTYKPVRLSDYRGKKNVVLVFIPLAFSPTCQAELCALRDELPTFSNDEVETVAVTCDTAATLRAWAQQQGFEFPVLSDFWPHGEVTRRYGVFDDRLGVARRATFIIDRDGIVRYSVVNEISEARDEQEYERVLAELGAA